MVEVPQRKVSAGIFGTMVSSEKEMKQISHLEYAMC